MTMTDWTSIGVAACCLFAASVPVAVPVAAEEATFGQLLSRAHAEADAGKQWSPPGDNVTETFASMMALLPQASGQELDDFRALLARQQNALHQANPASAGSAQPADAPQKADPAPPKPAQAVTQAKIEAAPPASAAIVAPASPQPAVKPSQPAAAEPPQSAFSKELAVKMLARGKEAESHGDIAGARRFYRVAADNRSTDAARALGRMYDPNWLRGHTLGGVQADPDMARKWYEIADKADGGSAQPDRAQTLTVR